MVETRFQHHASRVLYKKLSTGLPGGVMAKFTHSTSVAEGLQVRIPLVDLAPLSKPCCGGIPHTKQRMIGGNDSSATIFLKQKEEDWQLMLAHSQSSSPKKKTSLVTTCNWIITEKETEAQTGEKMYPRAYSQIPPYQGPTTTLCLIDNYETQVFKRLTQHYSGFGSQPFLESGLLSHALATLSIT